MKHIFILILSLLGLSAYAQSVQALRISESISIDGKLDEGIWSKANSYSGFTTIEPSFNKDAALQPQVKMMYDDDYVYFGVFIPANHKQDIKTQLSSRDNIGNADWFMILIDTYGNGTSANQFLMSAGGVQFDASATMQNEDKNWDAVWKGAVSIQDNGWSIEYGIPYSALRFPKTEIQPWKINFVHRCISNGEKSTYYKLNPEIQGFINQTASVSGVNNIKSPLRLSLTPYMTTYYTSNKTESGFFSDDYSISGGLDLKYGINDAFTLDMTLVPDFGQVRADDNVLNLSPFEMQFSENRPFFTEGLDLFRRANLFYTRRVGGRPIGLYSAYGDLKRTERVINNPANTRLMNATKISGRTTSGWGLGFFNAIARKTEAEIEDNLTKEKRTVETSPLTNYNVSVVDKNLPHNSYVSIINTNVTRFNSDYHNANVTGLDTDLRLFDENVRVQFRGSYSQLLNKNSDNQGGYNFFASVGKAKGRLNYNLAVNGVSKDYNNNDLGFNTQTNVMNYSPQLFYFFNDGLSLFSTANIQLGYNLSTRMTDSKIFRQDYSFRFRGNTANQWRFGTWAIYNANGYDPFEARQEGQLLEIIGNFNTGFFIGSDEREKFRFGLYLDKWIGFKKGFYNDIYSLNTRYRITDKLTVGGNFKYDIKKGFRNFVGRVDNQPIIGLRDRNTFTNTLWVSMPLTSKISISSRVRHYWSNVSHTGYYGLNTDGSLTDADYQENPAYTYNGLNANTEFKWRFAPGSDIVFVWQNNISGRDDFNPLSEDISYIDGVKQLKNLNQNNSVSLRVVYFLDAGRYL